MDPKQSTDKLRDDSGAYRSAFRKEGGLLWMHDYIGESRFQYDDQRLAIRRKQRPD